MSQADVVARTSRPLTARDLRAALDTLQLPTRSNVLVHSSLSRLGWVVGGAPTVVEALRGWIGASGTLVMPTFGGIDDPARWENPPVPESWWQTIRDTAPGFDPLLTPTAFMGAIVDCFRHVPGVQRSSHPTLSFSALGPAASRIVGNHRLDHGLGEGSPLARLYELDGYVLLLGVGHGNNTSLHLAEHRADLPDTVRVRQGSPVLVNGERRWVEYDAIEYEDDDFEQLGADFTATGQETTVLVGSGNARFMRQRALVDFGTPWLRSQRGGPAPPPT